MSLDIYLIDTQTEKLLEWESKKAKSIEEAGGMKGLIPLIEEYYDDRKPRSNEVFWANITNNLITMASESGIYDAIWNPNKAGYTSANDIIEPLTKGLALLKSDPERFKKFNSPNGWGTYKDFVPWVERYLEECKNNPGAIIEISL